MYPNTVFHFTKTFKMLADILASSFKTSYCLETIVSGNNERSFAVPMVSFCDLRLSELNVIETYGNYGIGLTKQWANRKGLNPVFYTNSHSPLTEKLLSSLSGLYPQLEKINSGDQKHSLRFFNSIEIYRYIKIYQGKLERRNGTVIQNYRFADEREWRYVPRISPNQSFPIVSKTRYHKEGKEFFNLLLKNRELSFDLNDVKYLIIDNESEISDLLLLIQEISIGIDPTTIEKLKSRILTKEQIKDDL